MLIVGYPKEFRAYCFYHTKEQNVFVNNRVFFLEKKFFMEGTDATKIEHKENLTGRRTDTNKRKYRIRFD